MKGIHQRKKPHQHHFLFHFNLIQYSLASSEKDGVWRGALASLEDKELHKQHFIASDHLCDFSCFNFRSQNFKWRSDLQSLVTAL